MATEMQAGDAGHAGHARLSPGTGLAAAAALTVLVGFFAIVIGFSGVVKADFVTEAILVGSPIAWGWVTVAVGVLQLLVAYPMGQPRLWALAGAVPLAIANGVLTANLLGQITAYVILLLLGDALILVLVALSAAGQWRRWRTRVNPRWANLRSVNLLRRHEARPGGGAPDPVEAARAHRCPGSSQLAASSRNFVTVFQLRVVAATLSRRSK